MSARDVIPIVATLPPVSGESGAPSWPSGPSGPRGKSGSGHDEHATMPGSDAARPPGAGTATRPELPPGTAIGRYMILGRLGSGAMGVVYSAYDPELDRKVALKLLHPRGGSTLDSRVRLMREAKALARLSHPNVVAVHDVGTYDDRVFLAMEFVDGKTLSAWLKEKPPPWAQIVAIMRKAGEGLAAAHDAGLVHRDFKPDNVLIARDGRVRVLDFGLARSAADTTPEDPDPAAAAVLASVSTRREFALMEAAQLTRTGALVGTPAYMSPEQHLGRSADARSDQFSFCVTLYQALYGARPFAAERMSGLAFQVLQGKITPPPPGTTVPTRVRRVVLRGLSVDPELRYPGMPALLAALDHEVGIKRRGGWVAGGAGVVTVGLGLWLGLGAGGPVAEPPCRSAAARLEHIWSDERSAAIEQAFQASGLPYAAATWTSVRAGLDAYAEEWIAGHTEACEANVVRHEQSDALFDRRMRCLERRRVELRALTDLLGRGEPAAIEQAGEGVSRLGPLAACSDINALGALVDPPDGHLQAEVDRIAAQLALASARELAGAWREALDLSAAAVADAAAAAYPPIAAEALRVHAHVQRLLDEPAAAAESLLAAARAAARGHDDRAAAEAWTDLVLVAGFDLNEAEAMAAYASAADAAVLRVDGDPLMRARLDINLSAAQLRLGAVDDALASGLRALATFDTDARADPSQRHRLLSNLALVYKARGQFKEAREALTRALDLVRRISGPGHPSTANLLTNLGELALDEGRLDEARLHADEATTIRRLALPPEHLAFADSERLFGRIAEARDDITGALAHYRRALELHTRSPRPNRVKIAALHNDLAILAVDDDRLLDALPDYRSALEGFRDIGGPDSAYTLSVEANLAETLLALGRADEALPLQAHVVAVQERQAGPHDPETAAALVLHAQSLRILGDAQAALPLLERALPILLAAPAADTALRGRLGLCRYVLARTLADLHQDRERRHQLVLLAEPELAADADANVFSRRALAELRSWRALQP